jgi:alcohol dehydrogenase class IV
MTIISRTLVPEISVIDPRLLTTMPEWLNAATGLDALTHAIEAFVSKAHNLLTDNHALHAVQLITGHLLGTQHRPNEVDPRLAMAQGSLEAGMAFTNAILGATHAMSHQVGGLLDAPHGVVNGVLLPHVIRFNADVMPQRYRALATAAGLPSEGAPSDELAYALAEKVRDLADAVGVPKKLSSLGVTEADVPRLARTTLKDACLATNPRDVEVRDIEALFRAAL